jgi:hypothetical protein
VGGVVATRKKIALFLLAHDMNMKNSSKEKNAGKKYRMSVICRYSTSINS